MLKPFYLTLFLAVAATQSSAQETAVQWPVPDVPDLLFYIQRDPDINTVVYTMNYDKNGKLDHKEPVKVFWIKYAEGGVHQPLNLLQKDLAYGVSTKNIGTDKFELKIAAHPKMPLYLQKSPDNKFHVYTTLNQKNCILKRIYIRIKGGSHLAPDVEYLKLFGTEAGSGAVVTETLYPHH